MCHCVVGVESSLSGRENGGGCVSVGAALPEQECIGVRLKKGSDNQGACGKVRELGRAQHPPRPLSEMMSLTPAEAPALPHEVRLLLE